MLKRPWPKDEFACSPVPPAPLCINPAYGIYDPAPRRRRVLSPLAACAIFAAAFLILTVGLRPAVGLFVVAAEALRGW